MTDEEDEVLGHPVEKLAHNPRKLPPWHLTGFVLCYEGRIGTGGYKMRERWDNIETGETELRPVSVMSLPPS